ncbi:MAG: tRNA 5-methoxyuridine(34)/uridine 5-oxyacetic acid(34) synthase CmoB, partial [Zetaproteobacteria bacterium]
MIKDFVRREQKALARSLRDRLPHGIELLEQAMDQGWRKAASHGDWPRWEQAIRQLPSNREHTLQADEDTVRLGPPHPDQAFIRQQLLELHPWRKGPFCLFGVNIDTEWRSDMKWRRLQAALPELENRTVLDIGCGSGYHLWRMHARGAVAIGIDPTPLFAAQFMACKRAAPGAEVFYLPTGIEQFPDLGSVFDVVFSMGVLYHRKSPIDHLERLRSLLKPGGHAFLETLVVEGRED